LGLAGCGGGGGGGTTDSGSTVGTGTGGGSTGGTGGTCVAASQQTPVAVTQVSVLARSAAGSTAASVASADQGGLTARAALAPRARLVALAEVTPAKLASETSLTGLGGGPRKVGFARALPSAALDWQTLADGRKSASISVTSPAAKAVRLGLLVRSLPGDATVRIYAQGAGQGFEVPAAEVLAALKATVAAGATGDAARTYWAPAVNGAEVTLEVSLPAGADTAKVDVAVPQLSHLFALPTYDDGASASVKPKIGEAASCETDATCDASFQAESNAVARIVFVDQGASYQCTGTLLNDQLGSGTPYLLTANHCISTQAAATTLQSYWFYRAPTCGAGTLSPAATTRSGGATLLYASARTDTSFMRLNNAPPAGVTYAGWSVAAPPVTAPVGTLHHPEGDLLKLSQGTVKSYQNCTVSSSGLTCSTSTDGSGSFVDALFTSGSTEEGSSGAALFQNIGGSRYVIGQLYGGSSSCSVRSGSNIYGRFDAAYNSALKQWLAAPVVPTC
ncbi:MAG: hypothetical protein JWQ88_140, partial [Rhodoferax sp.]|nr:hypothetical protein [Rhodoferax sp.]